MTRIKPALRWILPLAFAIAAAGCVLPPKGEPHNTALDSKELGLGDVAAPPVDAEWWKSFRDPQLNDLVARLLAHNPQLADTLARVDRARAELSAAEAGNQPGFSFDGKVTYQRFAEKFIYPPPFAGNRYWDGQLTANLDWNLDFWGRQAATIRRAEASAKAASYDREAARLALAGALAQSYVQLYRAEASAQLAAQNEQQRQDVLALTKRRVAAGIDNTVEQHRAEAAWAQAQLRQHQADVAAELGRHELAALAGEGADAYAHITSPQPDLDTALPLPAELPADLLARRPDVLAAKTRVLAASEGRSAAHQAFYPDINLNAFAGFASIGLDNLLKSGDAIYGAGPAIHLPLFESKKLKAGYRAATADLDAAIADYNTTVLAAVQQVADELSLVQSTAQQLEESKQVLASAEANYALVSKRQAAGIDNRIAVLDARTAVLDARQTVINILAARATARVALLLSVGGSFDAKSLEAAHADTTSSLDARHD